MTRTLPRRRALLGAAAIGAALLAAGCSGYTTPAQNVTKTSAELHATVSCNTGENCSMYFRYGLAGGPLSKTTPLFGPISGGSAYQNVDTHWPVDQLQPGTKYGYQVCGNTQPGGQFACVGPQEDIAKNQEFTTLAYTQTFADSFEGGTFPQVFQSGAWCEPGSCPALEGSGAYVNQVTPTGYSAANGTKVAEAGLTTNSTRAETLQCHRSDSPYQCAGGEGSELFYEWSFRIPSNVTIPDQPFPTRPNIMQTKPATVQCYGGGMVIRPVSGDATRVDLRQNIRGGTITDPTGSCTLSTADTLFSLGNFTKDQWHHVLLHAKWSETSSGFEEMWIDGEPVMPKQTRPTMIHGTPKMMFRLGLYNSVNDDAGGTDWHVDYDDVKVGTP